MRWSSAFGRAARSRRRLASRVSARAAAPAASMAAATRGSPRQPLVTATRSSPRSLEQARHHFGVGADRVDVYQQLRHSIPPTASEK